MKYNPVPNSNWPISCEYQSEADDNNVYAIYVICIYKKSSFYMYEPL